MTTDPDVERRAHGTAFRIEWDEDFIEGIDSDCFAHQLNELSLARWRDMFSSSSGVFIVPPWWPAGKVVEDDRSDSSRQNVFPTNRQHHHHHWRDYLDEEEAEEEEPDELWYCADRSGSRSKADLEAEAEVSHGSPSTSDANASSTSSSNEEEDSSALDRALALYLQNRENVLNQWRRWFGSVLRLASSEWWVKHAMTALLLETWLEFLYFRWLRHSDEGPPLFARPVDALSTLRTELEGFRREALMHSSWGLAWHLGQLLDWDEEEWNPASEMTTSQAGQWQKRLCEMINDAFRLPVPQQFDTLMLLISEQIARSHSLRADHWLPVMVVVDMPDLMRHCLPSPRGIHLCESSLSHGMLHRPTTLRASAWTIHRPTIEDYNPQKEKPERLIECKHDELIGQWFWSSIHRSHLTFFLPEIWLPKLRKNDNRSQSLLRHWWERCSHALAVYGAGLRHLPIDPQRPKWKRRLKNIRERELVKRSGLKFSRMLIVH